MVQSCQRMVDQTKEDSCLSKACRYAAGGDEPSGQHCGTSSEPSEPYQDVEVGHGSLDVDGLEAAWQGRVGSPRVVDRNADPGGPSEAAVPDAAGDVAVGEASVASLNRYQISLGQGGRRTGLARMP